jgi:hypothetical protein
LTNEETTPGAEKLLSTWDGVIVSPNPLEIQYLQGTKQTSGSNGIKKEKLYLVENTVPFF